MFHVAGINKDLQIKKWGVASEAGRVWWSLTAALRFEFEQSVGA